MSDTAVIEHEFWRDRSTGRVYAVELADGIVRGMCGPLTVSEIEDRFLDTFDYSGERAAWLEEHREEFDLQRPWGPPPAAAAPTPSALDASLVGDAMHAGVVVCLPRAPLREVARIMTSSRIHAVVVWGDEEDDSEGIWGIVSDLDLVVAAAEGHAHARSAVAAAETPIVTVGRDDTLRAAAELMRRHHVRHLVVVSDGETRPVGILSTLDIAKALAAAA